MVVVYLKNRNIAPEIQMLCPVKILNAAKIDNSL
jgi:hypothetical protein